MHIIILSAESERMIIIIQQGTNPGIIDITSWYKVIIVSLLWKLKSVFEGKLNYFSKKEHSMFLHPLNTLCDVAHSSMS